GGGGVASGQQRPQAGHDVFRDRAELRELLREDHVERGLGQRRCPGGEVMPGYLLHVGATLQCPHGGTITAIPSSVRVTVGGRPVVTTSDSFLVAGCPVPLTQSTAPCLKVVWTVGASRVRVGCTSALI